MTKRRAILGGSGLAIAALAAVLWIRTRSEGLSPDAPAGHTSSPRRPALDGRHPAAAPGEKTLHGRVLAGDGQPVAGAEVLATAADNDQVLSERTCSCGNMLLSCNSLEAALQISQAVGTRSGEVVPLARATSGPDGAFELPGLSGGPVSLWAHHPTGEAYRAGAVPSEQPVDLSLRPPAWLTGTLKDDDRGGMPGVSITATLSGDSRFFEAQTDAKGSFRVGPLPWGDYVAVASPAGFLPATETVKIGASGGEAYLIVARPRSVAGKVEDGAGRPVSGIDVVTEANHVRLVTRTDEQGRFTVEGLQRGRYTLTASRGDEGALEEVMLRSLRGQVLLKLAAARLLEVSVVDEGGRPLEGAELSLEAAETAVKGKTGPDGKAELKAFFQEGCTLRAAREGYLDANQEPVFVRSKAPVSVVLHLKAAARVSGWVVDEGGQPVGQARLQLSPEIETEEGDSVESDADGGFTLQLISGNYRLTASREDFQSKRQPLHAPSTGVRVTLSRAGELEGTVADAEGRPIPSAEVFVRPANGEESEDALPEDHIGETDEHGRFHFTGVSDGDYAAFARETHYPEGDGRARSAAGRTTVSHGKAPPLALRFGGLSISGRVVTPAGEGLEGASVSASHVSGGETGEDLELKAELGSAASSGPGGVFKLEGLTAGIWALSAYERDHVDDGDSAHFPAGAENVVLTLSLRRHLSGRCVGVRGEPLPQVEVDRRVVETEDGRFSIVTGDQGEQTVTISAPGYTALRRQVFLDPQRDTDLGTLSLSPARVLHGTVVDAVTAEPVPGAMVQWIGDPSAPVTLEKWRGASGRSARTDADGEFKLDGLGPEDVLVIVIQDGYHSARQVVPAQQAEVKVSLVRGATLSGRVADEKGTPIPHAIVIARKPGAPPWERDYNASTSADGSYAISGLSAGTYVVEARDGADGHVFPTRSASVDDTGVFPLDFQVMTGGVTVTIAAPESSVVVLSQTEVPTPTSVAEMEQLVEAAVLRGGGNPTVFEHVTSGPYWVYLFTEVAKHPRVQKASLTVPAEGALNWTFPSQALAVDLPPP